MAALLVLGGTGLARVRAPALAAVPSASSSVRVTVLDSAGAPLEPRRMRASISRGLPGDLARLTNNPQESLDAQSLRFVICPAEPGATLPDAVGIRTTTRSGDLLAVLPRVRVLPSEPAEARARSPGCVRTPLIRVTADAQDAAYPPARERSLEGELGGLLEVIGPAGVIASLLVGGPRELGGAQQPDTDRGQVAVGTAPSARRSAHPTAILKAKVRARLVRTFPGGVPPFGRDDAEAVALMKQEIRRADRLWGQCGITFGDERELDVAVVDPPAPYLLSVGCGLGVSARGGQVNVLVDGRVLSVPTRAGDVPRAVALRLARAADRLGVRTVVRANPRMQSAALPSFDLEFRRKDGQRATVAPAAGKPVCSDPILGVCIGVVDLADGLDHFTNASSMTGTLEERALLRATIDEDLGTIDLVVVESFSRIGRIGESFVASEAASLGNVVVLNRAAFRVGARSHALAHELGHILLDRPGHPDDYGVDTPWNLMDSDAVDGTIFGPKHLTIDDCRRVWAQSGQPSPGTLLKPW